MTRKTGKDLTDAPARAAEIVREYGLFADYVHGITYDGSHVWAALGPKLVAFDPGTGVSGLEYDGADTFYCGGGASGKVRAVRPSK
jgi:hypothetical protein